MNKQKSIIDIILPTYNRKNKLSTAIKSIISQTYPYWQLHIVNDGGIDVSKIIDKFSDSRIFYYQIKHSGKTQALNYALKKTHHSYITYMDDDDIVFPNHLKTLITAAIKYKKNFVYTDTYLTKIDEKTNRIISQTIENDLDVTYEMLRFQNYINHKQILHTRKLYKKVGEYDEKLSILIDWDYIKRLAKISEPYHVKIITGNHFLYKKNNEINSISGLWKKNPEKVGKSLNIIFSKDNLSMVELYAQHQKFKTQIYTLQSELNSIKLSKFYKLWQIYCKLKKIFTINYGHKKTN